MKISVFIILLFITFALLGGCNQEQAPVSAPVPPTSPTPALPATPAPAPSPAPTPAPAPNPISTPSTPFVNVTGIWSGPYNSSVAGAQTVTLSIQQSGASITGTYASSTGTLGSISGTVSGNTTRFTITVTSPRFGGSFDGIGIVNDPQSSQPTMSFSYIGSSPSGGKESGSGNLQKQESRPTPSPTETPQNTPTPPQVKSIAKRIADREFPSIHQAWNAADNLPEEDPERTIARHDLLWHVPEGYGLVWNNRYRLLADNFASASLTRALAKRQRLLSFNPNIIMLAEIRFHDSPATNLPDEHIWWQRDSAGNRILGWAEGDHYLLDWHNPDFRRNVAKQAKAVVNTGVVDGIMLDWWDDSDPDRVSLVKEIRSAIGPDALIIVNSNFRTIPNSAAYVNGLFMETLIPGGPDARDEQQEWRRATETLLWSETNLREPRINAFETWTYNPVSSPDAINPRDNLNRMRATTTLVLTHSNGTALFADPNDLPDPDHLHNWYPFWDKSLGQPVGQGVERTDGAFQREFERGTAVYNPIGNKTIQVTFDESRQSVTTGQIAKTFFLPALDGDLYLKPSE